MKKFLPTICILIVVTLASSLSWAEIAVSLKLDRTQTLLTDSVQLIVSVGGSRDSGSTPVIAGLENFDVRPAGTSSRIEFINGQMTSGVDYTYFIQPQKAGTFQIGPARVQVNGETHTSNIAKLQVVKPAEGQGADRGPIFLTAELSQDTVYVEQQTSYILKLYLRRNVRNINLNLPQAGGLAFKQIAKPVEYRSTDSGQSYQVIEVRYALVPPKAGSYDLEAAKMSMTVVGSRSGSQRGFLDDPFSSFAPGRPVTVAGNPLQLTVRALPDKGKPPDFSGLVGKFQMWSKLEPTALKTGESATLTVAVSGQGNVNRIPDLKIPELDHIKIYADKPVLESTQDSEGLQGSKIMKWALVPEKDGRLDVPPVTVSFFDPENHNYKTLRSANYTLAVLPGKEEKISISGSQTAAPGDNGAVKQTIQELGRDIFPVHTAMPDFKTSNRLQLGSWLFWTLASLPLMLYLGVLGGMKLRRTAVAGQSEIMAKKAAREFYKQYRQSAPTCSKLLQLIRDYLNRRFSLAYGALTPGEAGNILNSRGVAADTAAKLQNIMQQLENAEYTGRGSETANVEPDLVQLVKQIEKAVR